MFRISAANPDNLPELEKIVGLFMKDPFSLFRLSLPSIQRESDKNQSDWGIRSSSKRSGNLTQMLKRQISGKAMLLTVQMEGELFAAILLRPLWHIPDTFEILAYGVNWDCIMMDGLFDDNFLSNSRGRGRLSQHFFHLLTSKLACSTHSQLSNPLSFFTFINKEQLKYTSRSHLSLLECLPVGTCNFHRIQEENRSCVLSIFGVPNHSNAEAGGVLRRVSQAPSLHSERQHYKRKSALSNKVFLPLTLRPSLTRILKSNYSLMGLHYEIASEEPSFTAGPQALDKKSLYVGSDGPLIHSLSEKESLVGLEELFRRGNELTAILPLSSGRTFGLFSPGHTPLKSLLRLNLTKSRYGQQGSALDVPNNAAVSNDAQTHFFPDLIE